LALVGKNVLALNGLTPDQQGIWSATLSLVGLNLTGCLDRQIAGDVRCNDRWEGVLRVVMPWRTEGREAVIPPIRQYPPSVSIVLYFLRSVG
jgi:hypothetical protein